MTFNQELWMRRIFEALRPIDSDALFNVALAELDFSDAGAARLEDFPAEELAQFVNEWLSALDPDGEEATTEWTGGGVRLVIRAKGRSPDWRGANGMPSFNLLEPEIDDLHFTTGERRRLIDLTLTDLDLLAEGRLTIIGQGASYQDTFQGMAAEMRHFDLEAVADMHPNVILVYASMLGLASIQPESESYDATWRAIHRIPPDS